MKECRWRKWHAIVGLAVFPWLVLQAGSGIVLSLRAWRRLADGSVTPADWEVLMRQLHAVPGPAGAGLHLVLGLGLIWMALSGAAIYLRKRSRRHPGG